MSTDGPSTTDPAPADGARPHPWHRYVALGDSFTEGIGDPVPGAPGGYRGWADLVADALTRGTDDLAYANLGIRGRLLGQILDEQIEPAVAWRPDLISLSAGGNDVIRPGSDPDALAARLDAGLGRLASTGATLVLFTGVDVAFSPVFRPIRGKVAIYNEHLRVLAAKHGARVADQWGLTSIHDARMWAVDRLHLNPAGHREIARLVLGVLDVPVSIEAAPPDLAPRPSWRAARADDLAWAREYLGPWIGRRIRRTSSGDGVAPKRPV